MEEQTTAAEIIRKLAGSAHGEFAGVPFVIVPKDHQLKLLDELVPPKVHVAKANVQAHDVHGFIDYINTFKLDNTRIFAALEPKPQLKAIVDYHAPTQPQLGAHIVHCAMQHSEEWKRWSGNNKTPMTQKEFGLFIEDNAKDVIKPSGGDLLEMALNFSSLRTVTFASGQRLQDGTVSFEFKEEEKTGRIKLPPNIELALPVFRGDDAAYKVSARLKYQLKEGQLAIWYELERPDLVIDDAYKHVIEDVAQQTGIEVFRGMPA